jgi:RimJ/RimL family protein N-acetyltransferase
MEIQGSQFLLRPYREGDQESLVAHANNRKVWENLGNQFPHPYTRADADWWIGHCAEVDETQHRWAIDIDGDAVGGIGLDQMPLYSTNSWSTGYWLGETFWGRGVVTEAVRLVTAYAFEQLGARRVQAWVFDWNPASRRVLEKNGFQVEGRLRQMVEKGERVGDCIMLGRVRGEANLLAL